MAQRRPVIHARDHGPGGADPAFHGWESLEGGGAAVPKQRVLLAVFDGAGGPVGAGMRGDVSVPFASTITSWVLLADQPGSLVVDIWKDAYANYPPRPPTRSPARHRRRSAQQTTPRAPP